LDKGTKTIFSPIITGILVGIFVLSAGLIIASLRYQVLIQHEEREAQEVLELIEQNIERTIQESYSAALTLALTVNDKGEVKNFNKIAESLHKNSDVVDVLELVPNGVIEYVYPLEGNESVLGYDILSDPKVNAEVVKAAELGNIYFAGPINLKQGGQAVIGRLPITIADELWGYSAILIYLETLIEKSGIYQFPKDRYYFQLSKINPNTGMEEFFLPVNDDVDLDSYSSVNFPEGDWRLYTKRIDTDIAKASFLVIVIFSLVGGIVFGFVTTKFMQRPEELKDLLHQKSEQLLTSREKFKKNSELLQSMLESPRGVVIFSIDKDYNYLAFTNSHKTLMKKIWGTDIELGKNMLDYVPDEEMRKALKVDFDKALQGNYFEYIREFDNEKVAQQYWENRFSPIYSETGKVVGLTAFITDITKRMKVEKEIIFEKQLSDSIINSLPGVFYLFNKEGKYLRWNENLEKVSNYTPDEIEKAHPLNFFHKDEKELLTEKIGNVFIEGYDSVEAHLLTKEGEKIPYYFTGVSLDYNGEECLLGVGFDISEQKLAEKRLEKVFLQLQTHLNNSPLGVVEYDNDLNITKWSKRCVDIFGWDEDEIHGKNAIEIIYSEDKSKTQVIAHDLKQGRVDSNISHNRNYTKSGKIIDCIWYNSVIKDDKGQIVTVMSLVEDVTEKKKAEELVKQSEKRYRTLISNSPYCIHELDFDQKILSMNQAGLGMLCLENEEEVIGTTYSSFVKANDKTRVNKLFEKALEGEASEFEFEVADGAYFMSSFIPIKNKDEKVERIMGITQDITERRNSAEIIENSLKEKTTLLSEIHHRVKNNLAIVSGLLQLQKNEVKDEKVTIAFEQSINRIISIAMVHELMYKSPELSSVNIHKYLDMLIPAIASAMNDHNRNIEFKIDIDEYKLNINQAIPIGLLLNELITNSFKYAFQNQNDGFIKIELAADGEDVSILYEDNGSGFEKECDFDKPKNLGLNLIHTQLQQLEATYKADTDNKFKLEFTFQSEIAESIVGEE
jgi:PAS domain S-box-containing protein